MTLTNTANSAETSPQKIAFIGCGNMASAIISGLIKSGWPSQQVFASNPSQPKLDALKSQFDLHTTNDNRQAVEFADIVVLAVKPQKLSQVCQSLANIDFSEKLVISVAAGYLSEKIGSALKQSVAIIRAMPNTPSLIGLGATGLFANDSVTQEQKKLAEQVFAAVGTTTWVKQEEHINTVTAIAGSSPAYVFLMMQAMVEQAVESGLTQEAAFELVTQAFSGAAQLAQQTPEKPIKQLRQEVTSPGGTTAAAINSFKNDDFENIVKKAVRAAAARGQELSCQS